MFKTAILSVIFAGALPGLAQTSWSVVSPDGAVRVGINSGEKLSYSVSFHGRPAVSESGLGLEFEGIAALAGPKLKFSSKAERTADTTWTNRFGKNSTIRDHFNELALTYETGERAVANLQLIVRAYDDGAALRYSFPIRDGDSAAELTLKRELTEFRFPNDPTVWAATYDGFSHPYEHEYPKAKLSSIYPSLLIGLPLVVQTDAQTYLAISEADLTDWAGMYLKTTARNAAPVLKAELSPRLDGSGLVRVKATRESPWRVVMLGNKPGDLVESDLISNLSPPSAITDMSWVVPGKIAWDHWWSGDVKVDNPTEKHFIQFAGDMGFPYQLVDWQWYGPFNKPEADITKPAPQLNMPELLTFAGERNVKLWLWLHSGDVNRALRNGTLDEAFTVYNHWGESRA